MSPRPSGWKCEHLTITGGQADAATVVTGPCGCTMQPFFAEDPGTWKGVTIRHPCYAGLPEHYAKRQP